MLIKVKKKGVKRRLFWYFLLRGISYPRPSLGGQCKSFVVCVYVVLLLRPGYPNPNGFHITVLSTSILFALSKPVIPNAEHFCKCSPVEMGRIELPSKTLFSLLHTAITSIYYRQCRNRCQLIYHGFD